MEVRSERWAGRGRLERRLKAVDGEATDEAGSVALDDRPARRRQGEPALVSVERIAVATDS